MFWASFHKHLNLVEKLDLGSLPVPSFQFSSNSEQGSSTVYPIYPVPFS